MATISEIYADTPDNSITGEEILVLDDGAGGDTKAVLLGDTVTGQTTLADYMKTVNNTPTYDLPTADLGYSGETIICTEGSGAAVGDLLYAAADGVFYHTDSDAEATSVGILALYLTATTFLVKGYLRNDAWAFTVGAPLFISGTAGEITETRPTGTGKMVRIVGIAKAANIIFFNPSNDYIELR